MVQQTSFPRRYAGSYFVNQWLLLCARRLQQGERNAEVCAWERHNATREGFQNNCDVLIRAPDGRDGALLGVGD
jgi:hypothetical protein